MPYVRTKYEIVKCETVADVITKVTFKDNFVKASDSIEELCDEYVTVNNADGLPFRLSVSVARELEDRDKTGRVYSGTSESLFEVAKNKLKGLKEFIGTKEKHDSLVNYLYEQNPDFVFEGTVKGAIWTDRGLIYVAEVNAKGELELL